MSSSPPGWSAFHDLAWDWGQRIDLTSAKDRESLAEILFLDARQIGEHELVPQASSVVDIGAGVGAPTLPLLLAQPGLRATLVEPRRKRVAFLRHVVGALGLENRVDVIEATVDPTRPEVVGAPFDMALSRATFEPAQWLKMGAKLAAQVLVFLADQEPPTLAGWQAENRVDYEVPSSGAPRSIVLYRSDGMI